MFPVKYDPYTLKIKSTREESIAIIGETETDAWEKWDKFALEPLRVAKQLVSEAFNMMDDTTINPWRWLRTIECARMLKSDKLWRFYHQIRSIGQSSTITEDAEDAKTELKILIDEHRDKIDNILTDYLDYIYVEKLDTPPVYKFYGKRHIYGGNTVYPSSMEKTVCMKCGVVIKDLPYLNIANNKMLNLCGICIENMYKQMSENITDEKRQRYNNGLLLSNL